MPRPVPGLRQGIRRGWQGFKTQRNAERLARRGNLGILGGALLGSVVAPGIGTIAGGVLGAVGPGRLLGALPWGAMGRGTARTAGLGVAGGFEAAAGAIGAGARIAMKGGGLPGRLALGAAIGGSLGGLPGAGVGMAFMARPTMKLGLGGLASTVGHFAVRRPGLAGGLLGAAMMIPTLLRGAREAVAPSESTIPQYGFGNFDQQYGLDPNNLNTQDLTLALHYRR